jgi:glycerophosphoryl diester phosphodiesterase
MKIIAHRGNIDGPNPLTENQPEIIDKAIDLDFDVEIDIRYNTIDGQLYLGHDDSQYIVTQYWLAQRMDHLWIHCKNLDALYYFVNKTSGYNYFWHETDKFTLTSKKYIWTYPGQPYTASSVIVMPELSIKDEDFSSLNVYNCYGICTDYPQRLVK